MILTGNLETLERPGYFGRHKADKVAEFQERYGANWTVAWKVGDCFAAQSAVVLLYEDAYFRFLEKNPDILEELVRVARNVYDDAPSNIHSHLDYSVQETKRTHLQDIAIRRCVLRFGQWFKGRKLLQIRDKEGDHLLSLALSPGRVPFHLPWLIEQSELKGWWQPGSIESFYQSNKFIVRTV